jgi:patatin-like phospholipase/acyl hydrolase
LKTFATQGIAIVRLLRQLENRTGRRIHELFDLVCGTSTGGILAVALALMNFTLDQCEQIYRWNSSSQEAQPSVCP